MMMPLVSLPFIYPSKRPNATWGGARRDHRGAEGPSTGEPPRCQQGRLLGYIKGKETKGIIIINHKVLKAVMFCDSNYATEKETRKSVSGLVSTLASTLITFLSKTQTTVTLSSI